MNEPAARTVLFVCVHNAGRSQMAAAFFNQLVDGNARALSAGTRPADAVNPVVVEAMKEVGLDISGARPRLLDIDLITGAEKMITMGCGAEAEGMCPASFTDAEDWQLDDPAGRPIEAVRPIRDEVRRRVGLLVREMGLAWSGRR
jgi:arsenate reductase